MEKRKPHHDLEAIKAALATTLRVTRTARKDANALGFEDVDVAAAVTAIERRHFVKSMTAYADHKVWQDVYNVPSLGWRST